MTNELTRRHDHERRETLWQIALLHVIRHLIHAGAGHLDAAATWSALAAEAAKRADQQGAFAVKEGVSYAEVARVLGNSRQAAAKRYRVAVQGCLSTTATSSGHSCSRSLASVQVTELTADTYHDLP